MSQITAEEIQKVAMLARLSFDDAQTAQLQGELGSILDYIRKLNELDTENVEPFIHPNPVTNVFREDEPTDGMPNEQALANAPAKEGPFFVVPKTLDTQ